MKPIVDWYGVPRSIEGYGKHCRNIVKNIDLSKINLLVFEISKRNPIDLTDKEKIFFGKVLDNKPRNKYLDKNGINDIKREALEVWNLQPLEALSHAYNLRSYSDPEVYNILYTIYEGETVPTEWMGIVNNFNEVWCPSQFALDAFERTGLDVDNTLVVPEGVDSNLFKPNLESYIKTNSNVFSFLSIFDFTYRKGWDKLVKAYCNEFNENENVELIIKTHLGKISPAKKRYIKKRINKIRDNSKHHPKIKLLIELVKERDMPQLYNSGDAFVLPSRGEGFGLPIFEAAACGLPVITTDYGGPYEFLPKEKTYWVNHELEPYPFKETIMHEPNCTDILFANPRTESLQEQMRKVYECENPKIPDISSLTWEKGANLATQRLKEIWEIIDYPTKGD